jgi:hypothetical protein
MKAQHLEYLTFPGIKDTRAFIAGATTQPDDIRHNDTQHKGLINDIEPNDTQHNETLPLC